MALAPLVLAAPAFCACCTVPGAGEPTIFNRPGLARLDYRVATYATFRQAMLDAIAGEPRLVGLATRDAADYSITLLELFSAVGDVLTFYNERIANELFLRTALNRDSVLRLVRLIGYQLRPGLAATTLLAFTLDNGAVTKIRAGLKVMSVPAQDERPQTFETIEALTAHGPLNALPVFMPPAPINPLGDGRARVPILARPERLVRGERLAFFNQSRLDLKDVVALEARPDGEHLRFSAAIQGAFPRGGGFGAKVLRPLNLFAHDAPDSYHYFDTNPATPVQQRWKTDSPSQAIAANAAEYPLDRKLSDLKPGATILADLGDAANPRYQMATVIGVQDRVAGWGLERRETVTHVALRQTIRGRPTVVEIAGAGVRMFARSATGTVLSIVPIAFTQTIEPFLGLTATEDPAAVSWGPGRVDLFVRDEALGIQQKTWQPAGWSAWINLNGIATSRPAVVSDQAGNLWLFVRGLDLALWFRRFQAGAWSAWTSLGGGLTSAPAAVSWGAGRVDVFVRGLDLALWRRSWSGGAWTEWESLDGALAGVAEVASTAANRLDVAVLDLSGTLLHRRWNGTRWSAWQAIDGPFVDAPAIAPSGPDQVELLARKADGALYHVQRAGNAWMPAALLEGGAASAPSAVVTLVPSLLLVTARLADGSLGVRLKASGVWEDWIPAGWPGLGAIADRRQTRLFELDPAEIRFRDYDYPEPLRGGQIAARLDALGGLASLDKGRRLALDDGRRRHIASVTQTVVLPAFSEGPGHLLIGIDPPVAATMGATLANGNLVKASHGETPNPPDEPLGHGDAAKSFQRFKLRRAPLTYLPSTQAVAGAAALELHVNGELWREMPSLFGHGPNERIYTLRQTNEGETIVGFGDGRTGARLASGAMNVVARYRTGLGLVGRLKAEQLTIPLERPVGLRGVTNPLPAEGGADPETVDDARQAAPTTVRTFGRAISLEDFAWLATSSGLVARATATWVWRGLEKTIHLTVAAQGGATLSAAGLKELHQSLTLARDPNHPLLIANLNRVPMVVSARVMRSPDRTADDVLAAARQALVDFFAFETMPLARAVHASDIFAALQGALGVVAVDLDRFHLKGFETLTATELAVRSTDANPVQPHIRIYPARPLPDDPTLIDPYAKAAFVDGVPPAVLPAEQACVEHPLADIALSIVEAL